MSETFGREGCPPARLTDLLGRMTTGSLVDSYDRYQRFVLSGVVPDALAGAIRSSGETVAVGAAVGDRHGTSRFSREDKSSRFRATASQNPDRVELMWQHKDRRFARSVQESVVFSGPNHRIDFALITRKGEARFYAPNDFERQIVPIESVHEFLAVAGRLATKFLDHINPKLEPLA